MLFNSKISLKTQPNRDANKKKKPKILSKSNKTSKVNTKNVTFHKNQIPLLLTHYIFRSALTDYNVTPEPMHTIRVFSFHYYYLYTILAGCLCVSWGLSVRQFHSPLMLRHSLIVYNSSVVIIQETQNTFVMDGGGKYSTVTPLEQHNRECERDGETLAGSLMFEGNPYHKVKPGENRPFFLFN